MTTAVPADLERHVACLIVAIEYYPQIAIKMIKATVDKVLEKLKNNPNNEFMNSLDNPEKVAIKTLSTDGFNKMDIALLYKLIRYFNLVPAPTRGKWGRRPSAATHTQKGDDLERMRNNRNDIFHRPKGGVSQEERDTFFKESIEIACRIEDSTSSFETKIRNTKMYSIIEDQSKQALGKCPAFQVQLIDISGIQHVDLYYDDVIVENLENQDLPATDSTLCTLYIRGGNINGPVTRIMVEQINKESFSIKVTKSESGSLVLHVEINNICFSDKHSLHEAIAEFLQIVFTFINGSFEQHSMEVVLAECDSYIISDNEEENDQEPLVSKLDAMVMTSQRVDEAAACTALLDDKDARATQEDKTFGISTSSPLHGTSHEKNPEEACGSNVESEKGSNEEKIRTPRKNFIEKEKKLILHYYVSRSHECTWDTLMEIIYEHRKDELPSDIVEHYENLYEQNKLKDRIKRFIEKVHSGRYNETDPDIMALMKNVRCNPLIQ